MDIDWTRLNEAAAKAAEAIREMTEVGVEWVAAALKDIRTAFNVWVTAADAYAVAKRLRPDWVYKAQHCKKRRIRKKYHDRILRTYGGK